MSQTKPQDETTRIAVSALREWEQEVDAVQRTRLAAARHRALQPTPAAPRYWAGVALAATLLLALGVGFWPQQQPLADAAVLQALLESPFPEADVRTVELMLDDDLDFLLWLDDSAEHS